MLHLVFILLNATCRLILTIYKHQQEQFCRYAAIQDPALIPGQAVRAEIYVLPGTPDTPGLVLLVPLNMLECPGVAYYYIPE